MATDARARTQPQVLLAVVGWPVAHSRSPQMMNAALRAVGLDAWRYLRLPVAPESFVAVVRELPALGYRGVNVTIPHKIAAAELAEVRSDAVAKTGAANTLWFADGAVAADNTDVGGLLDAIPREVRGLRAVVLGAGGAARAAAWALVSAGAADVAVWNRTRERARELAESLGCRVAHEPLASAPDLLVNATSVGLDPTLALDDALAALGLAGSTPPATVVDLVYGDHETPLERWARRAGAVFVHGLEVLVRQGARSFERWTGRTAPLEVMRSAVGLDSGGDRPAPPRVRV
ncbi:Shikimate dehydrogenase (NADP(+)) [bacterium HR41]|nr:Shikimate dehydrogenase (NADP(+)) [bacterium HR41]